MFFNFILNLIRSWPTWQCRTLVVLTVDRDVRRVEAALGQGIHREVRILFYKEPAFLTNYVMTSLIPRPSSPAVSLGMYSKSKMPLTSSRMHICIWLQNFFFWPTALQLVAEDSIS